MPDDETENFDMIATRAKMRAKFGNKKPARRSREKKLAKTVDGRSLKITDRTEIFSFRSSAELKKACKNAAKKSNTSLAKWMEAALREATQKTLNGAGK